MNLRKRHRLRELRSEEKSILYAMDGKWVRANSHYLNASPLIRSLLMNAFLVLGLFFGLPKISAFVEARNWEIPEVPGVVIILAIILPFILLNQWLSGSAMKTKWAVESAFFFRNKAALKRRLAEIRDRIKELEGS